MRVDVWAGGRWRIQTGSVPVVAGRDEHPRLCVRRRRATAWRRAWSGPGRSWCRRSRHQRPSRSRSPCWSPTPDPEPEPGPVNDCGPRPAKADGTLWACTLAQDFTGTELDRSVWMPQTIFRSGTNTAWACYIDDPSVISVHDDALHLTVRKLPETAALRRPEEPADVLRVRDGLHVPAVQPEVRSLRGPDQEHRHHRSRTPASLFPALARRPLQHRHLGRPPRDRHRRTAPSTPTPAIPFLHYTATDNGEPFGLNTAWDCVAQRGEYNTFTLEWTATQLMIEVNGETCLVNTTGDPAFQKPYIVALTQLMDVDGNAYTGQAPMPASMTIDYVRVWQ